MIEDHGDTGVGSMSSVRSTGKLWFTPSALLVVELKRISSGMDLTAARNCTVRLNSSSVEASECEVSIPAGLAIDVKQTIGSQTSMVLVFNLQGQLTKTVTYTKGADAPQILTLP